MVIWFCCTLMKSLSIKLQLVLLLNSTKRWKIFFFEKNNFTMARELQSVLYSLTLHWEQLFDIWLYQSKSLSALGSLKYLRYLDASQNELQTIPESLYALTYTIETLNLSHNKWVGSQLCVMFLWTQLTSDHLKQMYLSGWNLQWLKLAGVRLHCQ